MEVIGQTGITGEVNGGGRVSSRAAGLVGSGISHQFLHQWQHVPGHPAAFLNVREAGEYEFVDAQLPIREQFIGNLFGGAYDGGSAVDPHFRQAIPQVGA